MIIYVTFTIGKIECFLKNIKQPFRFSVPKIKNLKLFSCSFAFFVVSYYYDFFFVCKIQKYIIWIYFIISSWHWMNYKWLNRTFCFEKDFLFNYFAQFFNFLQHDPKLLMLLLGGVTHEWVWKQLLMIIRSLTKL